MSGELGSAGAHVDAYYYCPHHPEGTVAPYGIACECRKPATGHDQEGVRRMAGRCRRSRFSSAIERAIWRPHAPQVSPAYHFGGGNLSDFVDRIIASGSDGGLPAANRSA